MASLPDFTSLSAEDRQSLEAHLRELRTAIVADERTIRTQARQIEELESQVKTAISGLRTIRTQLLVESAARSDRSFREEVTRRLLEVRQEFTKISGAKPQISTDEVKSDGSVSPLTNQAQYMAAAREIESGRDDKSRLFNDLFAAQFAGDFGRKFIGDFAKDLNVTPVYLSTFVAFLTRYIDDAIVKALNANADLRQVVILGAQGDSRAYRLSGLPDGVTFYHVDNDSVLSFRDSVFGGVKSENTCVNVSSNPSEIAWVDSLKATSFDATKPTVFVTEGKLAYMSSENINKQLTLVQSISCKGSIIIGDLPNRKNVSLEALHILWDKYADPVKTGCDEPEKLFGKFGFSTSDIQILGAGETNYGDRSPPHFVEHMASEPRGDGDKIPRILTFTMQFD